MRVIIGLLGLLFLVGCKKGGSELKAIFDYTLAAQAKRDIDGVLYYMDKSSYRYFEKLMMATINDDAEEAFNLGKMYKAPLSTLQLFYTLNGVIDDSLDFNLPLFMQLVHTVGVGILEPGADQVLAFSADKYFDGNYAVAYYLTGGISSETGVEMKIKSEAEFRREGEDWKIVIPSTFTFHERILRQKQHRSELDEIQFMKQFAQELPEVLDFRAAY